MKQSLNRQIKLCADGQKTGDTVEKLLNSVTTKFLGIFLLASFHMILTTPSYLQYKTALKTQMKSSLFSKQSFSTE